MQIAPHRFIVCGLAVGIGAPASAESLLDGFPPDLHCNGTADGINGYSNATVGIFGERRSLVDDFVVPTGSTWVLQGLRHSAVWGTPGQTGLGEGMEIQLRADNGGTPGPHIGSQLTVTSYTEVVTGRILFSRDEYEAWTTFEDVVLEAGHYWIDATVIGPENNFWLARLPVSNEECWVNYLHENSGTDEFGYASDLAWTLLGVGLEAPGACCLPNGGCFEETLSCDCVTLEGAFRGPGTICEPDTCPPAGACCFPNGACDDILDEDTCEISGGVFQGFGVPCEVVACPPFGACCLLDGGCTEEFDKTACEAAGGILSAATFCEGAFCPLRGACCLYEGACTELFDEAECDENLGVFSGIGIECGEVQCPALGACCVADGLCEQTTEIDCTAAAGEYRGVGSRCAEETQRVGASDPRKFTHYGAAVSVSGSTAIVGAPLPAEGMAYVLELDGDGFWSESIVLTAFDAEPLDAFGRSVTIDGDIAIVAAPDNSVNDLRDGRVYIFERNQGGAGEWGLTDWIDSPVPVRSGGFGQAVALEGVTCVIGANGADEGRGTAYVFRRSAGEGSPWVEVARLSASDGEPVDWFGAKASISGDRVVIGAYREDDQGEDSGSAYVFERSEGEPETWTQTAKLLPSVAQPNAYFGISVDIEDDRILVGARGEKPAGAAYVFELSTSAGAAWSEVARLTGSHPGMEDRFGNAVAILGRTLAIGADGRDFGEIINTGAVYVFQFHGAPADWREVARLVQSGDLFNAQLGAAVDVVDDTIIAGARGHVSATGAVYFFELDRCVACPADLDGSGAVDFADILAILSAWGNAGGPEDLDGSGTVDFGDLLVVLSLWGDCP